MLLSDNFISLYIGRAEQSGRVCTLLSNSNFSMIPLKLDTNQKISQLAVIPGAAGQRPGAGPGSDVMPGVKSWRFVASLS